MKLNTIANVCKMLNEKSLEGKFRNIPQMALEEYANDFVKDCCAKNNLTAHTISPFRWNFESTEHGMIDDGVVELRNTDSNEAIFEYVDISKAKLTDENNIMSD